MMALFVVLESAFQKVNLIGEAIFGLAKKLNYATYVLLDES